MRFRAIAISSIASALLVAASAVSAAESASAPAGNVPVFVQLQPLVLPVFEGNAVTRQASVVLALELEKGRTEADVKPLMRKLVDAYIAELHDIYEQRRHEDRVIDAGTLKPRLHETTTRILGPGIVREVLIQQAFERPRR